MLARLLHTLLIAVSLLALVSSGCRDMGSEPTFFDKETDTTGGPIFRKPNLYLYPTERQAISVKLDFPHGGRILESVPSYGSGWFVQVEPSGLINGLYRYLFYEAQVPDRYQYSEGWVVQGDSLARFFNHVLQQAGFTEAEIRDFTQYWMPLLDSKEQYEIYPQERWKLDELVPFEVSPAPDSILRFALVIQTVRSVPPVLSEPRLAQVSRTGFVLAEWGVVLK